jgi:hypothetical protein
MTAGVQCASPVGEAMPRAARRVMMVRNDVPASAQSKIRRAIGAVSGSST